MKVRIASITAMAAGLMICGTAHAEKDYSVWGIKAGLFMPTGSEIRDIFGDNWVSLGITPREKVRSDRWNVGFDVGLIYADRGGNSLVLVPATVGVSKRFAPAQNAVVPYAAVRTGLAYYDYAITRPSTVRYSQSKLDLTGNVEFGVVFSEKLLISARYDWFAKSDDFNFDGLTVWAQLLLFKF
jgi:hypothetical protein